MTLKRTKAAIAMLVAILLALVAPPRPASADADSIEYAWAYWQPPGSVNAGGYGMFFSYGEVLRVQDWLADGWGTRAQIQKLLPDSSGVLHWVNHSSNCFDDTSRGDTSPGGWTTCNYSLSEGTIARVHVWASRDGATRHHEYSPGIRA